MLERCTSYTGWAKKKVSLIIFAITLSTIHTSESKRAKFKTARFFRFVMLQIQSSDVSLSQSMHSTTATYAVAARIGYEQVLLTAFYNVTSFT